MKFFPVKHFYGEKGFLQAGKNGISKKSNGNKRSAKIVSIFGLPPTTKPEVVVEESFQPIATKIATFRHTTYADRYLDTILSPSTSAEIFSLSPYMNFYQF